MNVSQHQAIESASDEELVERLYEVARAGAASPELDRLDAIIYARLATAYGEGPAEPQGQDSLAA